MRVANVEKGEPMATHDKGGVLDIILTGEGVQIKEFGVGGAKVANSDHRMVWACLQMEGHSKPEKEEKWKMNKDVDWAQLEVELEAPLASWHKWFGERLAKITGNDTPREKKSSLLNEANTLFGAIVMSTLWKKDSPYGRFTSGAGSPTPGKWWSEACTEATKRYKAEKGTASEEAARKNLRATLAKARKDERATIAHDLLNKANDMDRHENPKKVYEAVRSYLRPEKPVSDVMKIEGTIISKTEALKIWPAYFEAQSSLCGQETPHQLLAKLRASTQVTPPEATEEKTISNAAD